MGMSASQARYLQLTSRMSDLELEGQQINQQRLNLANQTASISEQALRMNVPTAPSPYDFMKDAYEGTIGGKKVIISNNDDGTKTVAMQNSDVQSMEAIGISSAEIKPILSANAVDPPTPSGTTIKATCVKEDEVPCKNDGEKQITLDNLLEIYNEAKELVEEYRTTTCPAAHKVYNDAKSQYDNVMNDSNATAKQKSDAQQNLNNAQASYTATINAANAAFEKQTKAYEAYNKAKEEYDSYQDEYYYELNKEGKTVEVTAENGTLTGLPEYHSQGLNGSAGVPELKLSWTSEVDGNVQSGSAEDLTKASKGCSGQQIALIKSEYVTSDGEEPTFDPKTGLLTCEIYKETGAETINGERAYKTSETGALQKDNPNITLDELKNMISRIKAYELNDGNGTINSESLNQWRIVVHGGIHLEAVKIADGSSVQNFKETEMKEGFEEAEIIGEDIKKSGVGTVTIKCSDGTEKKVTVQKTQVKDDNAYGDAVAKYENDKAEYDRAQEDFNQKTKKIQEQDKQLELKLKRLDTERNALNTEIDAVKKVIQDNSDKSFKTFSG